MLGDWAHTHSLLPDYHYYLHFDYNFDRLIFGLFFPFFLCSLRWTATNKLPTRRNEKKCLIENMISHFRLFSTGVQLSLVFFGHYYFVCCFLSQIEPDAHISMLKHSTSKHFYLLYSVHMEILTMTFSILFIIDVLLHIWALRFIILLLLRFVQYVTRHCHFPYYKSVFRVHPWGLVASHRLFFYLLFSCIYN